MFSFPMIIVLAYCADIIQFCIIEFEKVPDNWLDMLLIRLLPSNKADNPTAYQLVAGTLRLIIPLVQQPLASLIHEILIAPKTNFQERSLEIAEEIYPLIYELHLISPPLLHHILPDLTTLLKIDEDEIRAKIVKLLCKIYVSDVLGGNNTNYIDSFPKDFKEFTSRINDRSSVIRNEMVEAIIIIMSKKPDVKATLETLITSKLRDPQEEIRCHCLSKLLESAQNNLLTLSVDTIAEIKDRVKDKKHEVRRVALTGLLKLYYRYLSSQLPCFSSTMGSKDGKGNLDSLTANISDEVLERLSDVPSVVLKCWGYPDLPTRQLVIHGLQEFILPRSSPLIEDRVNANNNDKKSKGGQQVSEKEADSLISDIRTSALVFLFRNMQDESDRNSFSAILNFKSKISDEISHFLFLKKGNKTINGFSGSSVDESHFSSSNETKKEGVDDSEKIGEIRQSLYNLTLSIPIQDKKHSAFDKLISNK
jgi:hypothetical protein